MRFSETPVIGRDAVIMNFQFSLWDSRKRKVWEAVITNYLSILSMRFCWEAQRGPPSRDSFQFSLWDSEAVPRRYTPVVGALSILSMRFAVYPEPSREHAAWAFQFSLWDSHTMLSTHRLRGRRGRAFNSLYEIPISKTLHQRLKEEALSILSMRFLRKLGEGKRASFYVFQFSLWDSLDKLS